MKTNGLSYIRKWLLLYLALVLLTTAGLYLVVYMEVTSTLSALGLSGDDTGRNPMAFPMEGLQLRLMLMLGGGLGAIGLLGWVWVRLTSKRVDQPVHTIAEAMTKLAKGQLNETVIVETSDELEHIGVCINELAANIQELLLYIWKQTGQCHALLDHIHGNPNLHHDKPLSLESIEHLKQLSAAIDDLREMAKAYVFYDVSIEGTNTQAINEPGSAHVGAKLPN